MISLAIDENLNRKIVRGLLQRRPRIDLVRVQDTGLAGADDPTVLAWAAEQGRVLLSHDVRTLIQYARDRMEAGLPMPGLFEVNQVAPLGRIIDDILLLIECSQAGEWEGQIGFIPFR